MQSGHRHLSPHKLEITVDEAVSGTRFVSDWFIEIRDTIDVAIRVSEEAISDGFEDRAN